MPESPTGENPLPVEVERIDLSTAGTQAAVVWLNRPKQLNAITWDVLSGLESAFRSADEDPAVRALLISGRGRAFCAGADLKTYLTFQHDAASVQRFVAEFQRVFGLLRFLRKPVIALVNGIAVAGGMELMLSCDFAYAGESARIGDAHLNYGQMGGGGSLTLLPRLIGPFRARELLFSARVLDAREALSWGLVNAVHPDAELLKVGIAFADGLATRSPAAVASAKYVMNAGLVDGTGIDASLRLERDRNALHNLTTKDSAEGLKAFGEGRQPRFTGE